MPGPGPGFSSLGGSSFSCRAPVLVLATSTYLPRVTRDSQWHFLCSRQAAGPAPRRMRVMAQGPGLPADRPEADCSLAQRARLTRSQTGND
jgi:hypothetical protein